MESLAAPPKFAPISFKTKEKNGYSQISNIREKQFARALTFSPFSLPLYSAMIKEPYHIPDMV